MDFDSNLQTLRRRARVGAAIHVIVLIALLSVCAFAGREAGTRFLERRTFGSGVTALVLLAAVIFFLWHLLAAVRLNATNRPRIVPYFQTKYFEHQASEESWAAFRRGYDIAAHLSQLDDLTRRLGVAPLSSFGFGDDLLHQGPQWSSIEDGLRTLTALIDAPEAVPARSDLATLAAALKKASEHQTSFALLVRYGKDDFISGVEMGKRAGNFWT